MTVKTDHYDKRNQYYYTIFHNEAAKWRREKNVEDQVKQLYTLLQNPLNFYNETLKMPKQHYR